MKALYTCRLFGLYRWDVRQKPSIRVMRFIRMARLAAGRYSIVVGPL